MEFSIQNITGMIRGTLMIYRHQYTQEEVEILEKVEGYLGNIT